MGSVTERTKVKGVELEYLTIIRQAKSPVAGGDGEGREWDNSVGSSTR